MAYRVFSITRLAEIPNTTIIWMAPTPFRLIVTKEKMKKRGNAGDIMHWSNIAARGRFKSHPPHHYVKTVPGS